jgi:hypothetical protein
MASGGRRRPDLRDPRAARLGAVEEEEETASGAAAFGKALMAILLALVIGAGGSYGYYIFSTPKAPANVSPPTATPTSTKSPTKSPTGKIPAHSALAAQSHMSASIAFVFAEPTSRV